jgi:hypothetical protein
LFPRGGGGRHASCIDGQDLAADDRIERALEDGGV